MFFSQTLPRDEEYHERDVAERDLGGGHDSFDQRIGMATEGSEYDGRLRWLRSDRSSDFENEQLASYRPSIGRRIFRTLARFFFVVLIGVGTTLAWQSYHEEAKEMVRTWVPLLGWLLPPTMKSPASAETSAELGQQLKPIALDLALIRRSVEQLAADLKELAAKQEQIAHDTATLQAVERDLRQNISSVPPPGAVQIPRPKPTQPSAQSLAAH
jgi:hypothetical protein